MAEPKLDATDAACLRQALTAAGYTSEALAAVFAAGGPELGAPLDTLLQVFEYGQHRPGGPAEEGPGAADPRPGHCGRDNREVP